MVKYDTLRKLDRNREPIAYHKAHPDDSLEELGNRFGGISKQAVLQVLQRNAIPTIAQAKDWITPDTFKWHGKLWRITGNHKVVEDKNHALREVLVKIRAEITEQEKTDDKR
jgi:hypothetical protein